MKKKVKSPYNWVISPLTPPQVANQQKKNKKNPLVNIGPDNGMVWWEYEKVFLSD